MSRMDKQQEGLNHCPSPEVFATYLDHNLTLKEKTQVEGHLAECGKCRKIIALAQRSKSLYPSPKQEKGK
jgi:predicted anti-sigma-YlaC factor YlaD